MKGSILLGRRTNDDDCFIHLGFPWAGCIDNPNADSFAGGIGGFDSIRFDSIPVDPLFARLSQFL